MALFTAYTARLCPLAVDNQVSLDLAISAVVALKACLGCEPQCATFLAYSPVLVNRHFESLLKLSALEGSWDGRFGKWQIKTHALVFLLDLITAGWVFGRKT
jgi:hypothetical protein